MTLPTSGPLTLANIQTEFGGANPIGLNEYYAGGAYVPSGTTGTYGAVPSSGTISIQNFYGTSNVAIYLADEFVSITTAGLSTAVAGYRLLSNGMVQVTFGSTYTNVYAWCTPGSVASSYEVFATVTSGGLSSGTTGSWLSLGTNREWTREAPPPQFQQCVFTLQIRKIGTTTVLATATITLEADATP